MIRAGSAVSLARAPEEAGLEASLEALARAGTDHVDLAMVFATGRSPAAARAVLHAVRRVTGARSVIGCSGTGVLTDRHEVEDQPAVAVLALRDDRLVVRPFRVEDRAREERGGATAVAEQVGSTVAEGGCLLLLPDAAGLDPCELLGGLQDELGWVPVVGGVAAGSPMLGLFNADVTRGELAGLALSGPAPIIGVAQGCLPIGEPFVITRAEGHVVAELGGRPALAVLQQAIAALPDGAGRAARAGIFAGLAMDAAKSPLDQGDFLVRNVLGADEDTGSVTVGEAVHVGQTMQFQIRDAAASRADLESALGRVAVALAGRRPAYGWYFDCAGRGLGLFGRPDHDVTLIRERLGEFPLVGFFGNGEFAPVGRRNFLHNYTGALVVYPAPVA